MPASRNDKCVRQGRAAIVLDAHLPGCTAARSPKYSEKQTNAVLWRKSRRGVAMTRLAPFVGFLACLLGNEPARCDSGDSAVNIQVPFMYENARVFVPSFYTIGERGLMDSAILQNLICDASDD